MTILYVNGDSHTAAAEAMNTMRLQWTTVRRFI